MNYKKAANLIEKQKSLQNKISDYYSEIVPLLEKYFDTNTNAKIFMADMLLFGWGIKQEPDKSEKIFEELANNGNPYAMSIMFTANLLYGWEML